MARKKGAAAKLALANANDGRSARAGAVTSVLEKARAAVPTRPALPRTLIVDPECS